MAYTVRIFWERDFDDVSSAHLHEMKSRINREANEYLLNVNRTEYLDHITAEFQIAPLVIRFDDVSASSSERMIPAEQFPFNFNVMEGKSYPKQVVRFHVPFSGEERLLGCRPNPQIQDTLEVRVDGSELSFEIVEFSGDAAQIKASAESVLNRIRQQAEYLDINVRRYNEALLSEAQASFDNRKKEVMNQNQLLSALGVPVKRSAQVPDTFAVPATPRKKIVLRPSATSAPYEPEPTLDQTIFGQILKVINDTGHVFERLPSTYADKDEETLRDHFIMVLEPHFEIDTTGETFNKSGKTDILMRYEGKNVFVAECKFWSGAKGHHKTIDQLLSYLTWRDSKAAIVYFMSTKEMTAPLAAVAESSPRHSCFVATREKREESWFQYEFHLPGDSGRPVQLAILCFHLPR